MCVCIYEGMRISFLEKLGGVCIYGNEDMSACEDVRCPHIGEGGREGILERRSRALVLLQVLTLLNDSHNSIINTKLHLEKLEVESRGVTSCKSGCGRGGGGREREGRGRE